MESLVISRAPFFDYFGENSDVFSKQTELSPIEMDFSTNLASNILQNILQYRRSPSSHSNCTLTCYSCHSPHLSKVISAIQSSKPITFVLPAFPGKSPNLSKVLSPLPDMAERLALQFLELLCERIRKIYAPGAKIILCSDGRVFSDIVGMRETDITNYQNELDKMIMELGLKNITTFNLDELCEGKDFIQMRNELLENFGSPLELLKDKVQRGSKLIGQSEDEDAHRMYCGITRFLVEDATFPGQTKSRSSIQKECKAKAYELIRRSNAWSELISQQFPEAVRLSIHPQTCGSKKLGIRLVGNESWLTPWHGVALKTNEGFMLIKRTEAEAKGAQLVFSASGRPSHYELSKNRSSNTVNENLRFENEI